MSHLITWLWDRKSYSAEDKLWYGRDVNPLIQWCICPSQSPLPWCSIFQRCPHGSSNELANFSNSEKHSSFFFPIFPPVNWPKPKHVFPYTELSHFFWSPQSFGHAAVWGFLSMKKLAFLDVDSRRVSLFFPLFHIFLPCNVKAKITF